MDYRVELDVYNGPLDLLLYLIKRDELDIYDIPITRITDSYMTYVRQLKQLHDHHGLDINVAGEFLVMAATLMEIKSAMLLPKPPVQKEESSVGIWTDPRQELVRQLLEYKRIKDAAGLLEKRRKEQEDRYARFPAWEELPADQPPPVDLDEVQVWDLMTAFNRLLSEIGTRPKNVHEVVYDDTPIDLHAADVEDLLQRVKHITLRSLLSARSNRSEMIGVFLALLELIKQKKVIVSPAGEDDVDIEHAPPPAPQAADSQEGNPHPNPPPEYRERG
jgi:segregation and condensation protein A